MFPFFTFLSFISVVVCVPFVTKRVSLHNPINIDFKGWIPLSQNQREFQTHFDQMMESSTQQRPQLMQKTKPHSHWLTVPVAIETDAEHKLSEKDLKQISKQILQNWNQKSAQSVPDSEFPVPDVLPEIYPKPEIEKEERETNTDSDSGGGGLTQSDDSLLFTFVKMDTNATTQMRPNSVSDDTDDRSGGVAEQLFHAYMAGADHVPPEGYVKLTREEFQSVFRRAEIVFV